MRRADHRDVPTSDGDADCVRGARCSPTARRRRLALRPEDEGYVPISSTNESQIIRFSWPKIGPMKYQSCRTSGARRGSLGSRGAAVAVLVDEEVAGQAERDEVDRGPGDLVDLQADPQTAWIAAIPCLRAPRSEPDRPAPAPTARPDVAPDAEERTRQEHSFERHVDHPLRSQYSLIAA